MNQLMYTFALIITFLLIVGHSAHGESDSANEIALVHGGRAHAVIVIADDATRVASYAADELAEHVDRATGVTLDIISETDAQDVDANRIFVGMTKAAEAKGIDADSMEHDEFILRVMGNDLYVLGKEDRDRTSLMDGPQESRVLESGFYFDQFNRTSPNGTLFGIYEILDRYLGVRWLWPGEHGVYVPKTGTITIPGTVDDFQKPKIAFRRFLWSRIGRAGRLAEEDGDYEPAGRLWRLAQYVDRDDVPKIEGLTFSAPVLSQYYRDLGVFLARHRLGYSEPRPRTKHTFHWWWREYGEEHPEWFMMREDGGRGPLDGQHAAMCVSNPDLHRFIVEEYWDGGDYLDLGEVDKRVACMCEDCKAWDGPQPDEYPDFVRQDYEPRLLSDRYVRFYKTIQEMAAKRNPNVTVTSFLYINFFPAPLSDIELNDNIYGEFVPWTGVTRMYPQPKEVDEWIREQWMGWRERGIRMAYRPNHFHAGNVMPYISTRQNGDFFQFAYRNGMEGFAFDSLKGHWATRGVMLYMYMRLAWHPDADIEEIKQEYYEAFGPAAPYIQDYFEFWEEYSTRHALRGGGPLVSPTVNHRAFPAEVLAEGKDILNKALAAARQHDLPEYAGRVEFLRLGLEHARLSTEFWSLMDGGRAPVQDLNQFVKAKAALGALVEFRKTHEHLYFADLFDAALAETRYGDLLPLFRDVQSVAEERLPGMLPDAFGPWMFRIDPDNEGMAQRWFDTEHRNDEDWQPMTVPANWSQTHVGNYLGYGWYRTIFDIPAENKGQTLRLLFEGVDEEAWVFVNGKQVGEQSEISEQRPPGELWDVPFTVKVEPEHLEYGEDNVLVVRVHAHKGQAGIWRSVLAYFPDEQ